ncbi:UDP-GlcNAc--UDP-phosphate GlcNAc-1-phosphate transferase [Emticicia aquatilis]|uniref:UDP-GlcNAc--UDP-phosphate GlcNAc-1-phosphate transferase n=1 Tax=Emticicia aquatilis TaxID=1537369 RepID=A0A916YXG3_9BACT|nr:UDP-GlcNAc--UDP-phosphate GlcNAc-1-phosphate transferase [Emticicia aquatilis]GGD64488.1 UDP-GlcNAc--UDP-phosphate GlcNAc-1-phosphate transferase [Emticicia aquatilis]
MKNYSLLIWGAFLFIFEILYIKIANYFNIIDKPNERSLHSKVTIRGGGIVYWIAGLIYFYYYSDYSYPYFFLGFTCLVIISFIDDIVTVPNRYRLFTQFGALVLLLCEVSFYTHYSYYWTLPIVIIGVGILNAYNFMDGINGITGTYSLVILLTLTYINNYVFLFIEQGFPNITIISVLVFLIFNFRKKAICFGGDVGSIGIAYILIFCVGHLIYLSHDWKYIFLFTIYGMDSIYTILYRLQLKQNIFKAHKLHLFQILVYSYNLSHLQVTILYAGVQLILNIWIINQSANRIIYYIPFLFLLGLMHIVREKRQFGITIK